MTTVRELIKKDNGTTAIDFIMVRKNDTSMATDVFNTAFIPQHKVLICKVRILEKTTRPRQAFVSRIKVRRLKEEAVRDRFREVVERMEMSKNTVPDHEFTGFRIPDINRIVNSRSGWVRIPDTRFRYPNLIV